MTKKTFLSDEHQKLGAKMVDFAGWFMPVQYTSIIEEHKNVRNNLGIFDVSHMGEIIVEGKDALAFLNKLVPQELSKLTDGKAVYCQLLNHNAGLIDDLIIYKIEDNKYFIIANASRIDEDINWLALNKIGVEGNIINESHNYSLLAIQGPKIKEFMKEFYAEELPKFFSIKEAEILGIDVWISRTGYTGEDGVEILVKNENVKFLWNKFLEIGQKYSLKPIGLGARDTLRLEAALHLYGNDLTEDTTPIEAVLSWSVSKDKTTDYNGKEIILKQLTNGVHKILIGFKMLSKNIARHDYPLYYNNENIGKVTSGGVSPQRNENIGLAYIKNTEEMKEGTIIQVEIRGKLYDAEIVKLPFVNKNTKN